MVTIRKRWPDPFNGGVVRDESIQLGPGGTGGSRSNPSGDNVGQMRPPPKENFGQIRKWHHATGRTEQQRPEANWRNLSIKGVRRDAPTR